MADPTLQAIDTYFETYAGSIKGYSADVILEHLESEISAITDKKYKRYVRKKLREHQVTLPATGRFGPDVEAKDETPIPVPEAPAKLPEKEEEEPPAEEEEEAPPAKPADVPPFWEGPHVFGGLKEEEEEEEEEEAEEAPSRPAELSEKDKRLIKKWVKARNVEGFNAEYEERNKVFKQKLERARKNKEKLIKDEIRLHKQREALAEKQKKYEELITSGEMKHKQNERMFADIKTSFLEFSSVREDWAANSDLFDAEVVLLKDLEKNMVALRESFSKKWQDEQAIALKDEAASRGEVFKDIPLLWDPGKTVKGTVPITYGGKVAAFPSIKIIQVDRQTRDSVFEATKKIYDFFTPESVSQYTKGKSAPGVEDIDKRVTSKATEYVDNLLKNGDLTVPPGGNLDSFRVKKIEERRRYLLEMLFGMSISSEKNLMDPISRNNVYKNLKEVYNDADRLLSLSHKMYPPGTMPAEGDFNIMKFAIDAAGKMSTDMPLTSDPDEVLYRQKNEMMQYLHELGLGKKSWKHFWDTLEELPKSMTQEVFTSLPEGERRKATMLLREYGKISKKRQEMVLKVEADTVNATLEHPADITGDIRDIHAQSRKMAMIIEEVKEMSHTDIPMSYVEAEDILKAPSKVPSSVKGILNSALSHEYTENFNREKAKTFKYDFTFHGGTPEIILNNIDQKEIDKSLRDFKYDLLIHSKGYRTKVDTLKEYWDSGYNILFGRSQKDINREEARKAKSRKFFTAKHQLQDLYEQGVMHPTTPAFLRHLGRSKLMDPEFIEPLISSRAEYEERRRKRIAAIPRDKIIEKQVSKREYDVFREKNPESIDLTRENYPPGMGRMIGGRVVQPEYYIPANWERLSEVPVAPGPAFTVDDFEHKFYRQQVKPFDYIASEISNTIDMFDEGPPPRKTFVGAMKELLDFNFPPESVEGMAVHDKIIAEIEKTTGTRDGTKVVSKEEYEKFLVKHPDAEKTMGAFIEVDESIPPEGYDVPQVLIEPKFEPKYHIPLKHIDPDAYAEIAEKVYDEAEEIPPEIKEQAKRKMAEHFVKAAEFAKSRKDKERDRNTQLTLAGYEIDTEESREVQRLQLKIIELLAENQTAEELNKHQEKGVPILKTLSDMPLNTVLPFLAPLRAAGEYGLPLFRGEKAAALYREMGRTEEEIKGASAFVEKGEVFISKYASPVWAGYHAAEYWVPDKFLPTKGITEKVFELGEDIRGATVFELHQLGLISEDSIPALLGGKGLAYGTAIGQGGDASTLQDARSIASAVKIMSSGEVTVDSDLLERISGLKYALEVHAGSVMSGAERGLDIYLNRILESRPQENWYAKGEFGSDLTLEKYPARLQLAFKTGITLKDSSIDRPTWEEIKDKTIPQLQEEYYVPDFRDDFIHYAKIRSESHKFAFGRISHEIMGNMFIPEAFDPRTGHVTKKMGPLGKMITAAGLSARIPIEIGRTMITPFGLDPDGRSWGEMPGFIARVATHTALGDYGMMGETDHVAALMGLDPTHPIRTGFRTFGIILDFGSPWERSLLAPIRLVGSTMGHMSTGMRRMRQGALLWPKAGAAGFTGAQRLAQFGFSAAEITAGGLETASKGMMGALLGSVFFGSDPLTAFTVTAFSDGVYKSRNILATGAKKTGKTLAGAATVPLSAAKYLLNKMDLMLPPSTRPETPETPWTPRAPKTPKAEFPHVMKPMESFGFVFRTGLADRPESAGFFVPGSALAQRFVGILFEQAAKLPMPEKMKKLSGSIGKVLRGRPVALVGEAYHTAQMEAITGGRITYHDLAFYELARYNEKFMTTHENGVYYFLNKDYVADIDAIGLTPSEAKKRVENAHEIHSSLKSYLSHLGMDPNAIIKRAQNVGDQQRAINLIEAGERLKGWREPSQRLQSNKYYQRHERYLEGLKERNPHTEETIKLNKLFTHAIALLLEPKNPERFYQSLMPKRNLMPSKHSVSFKTNFKQLIDAADKAFGTKESLTKKEITTSLKEIFESIEKDTPSLHQRLYIHDIRGVLNSLLGELDGVPLLFGVEKAAKTISRKTLARLLNTAILTTSHSLAIDRVTPRSKRPFLPSKGGRRFYEDLQSEFLFKVQNELGRRIKQEYQEKGKKLTEGQLIKETNRRLPEEIHKQYEETWSVFRDDESHRTLRKQLYTNQYTGRIETPDTVSHVDKFSGNNVRSIFTHKPHSAGGFILTSMMGNWILSKEMKAHIKSPRNRAAIDFSYRRMHLAKIIEYAAMQGNNTVFLPLGEKGVFYQVVGSGVKLGQAQRLTALNGRIKSNNIKVRRIEVENRRRTDSLKSKEIKDKEKEAIKKTIAATEKEKKSFEAQIKKDAAEAKDLVAKDADLNVKFLKSTLPEDKPLRTKLESSLEEQLKEQFGEANVTRVPIEEVIPERLAQLKTKGLTPHIQSGGDPILFLKIKIPDEYTRNLSATNPHMYSPISVPVEEMRTTQLSTPFVVGSFKDGKHMGPKNAFELYELQQTDITKERTAVDQEIKTITDANKDILVDTAVVKAKLEELRVEQSRLNDLFRALNSNSSVTSSAERVFLAQDIQFANNRQVRVWRTKGDNPTIIETSVVETKQNGTEGRRVLIIEEYGSPTYKKSIESKTEMASNSIDKGVEHQTKIIEIEKEAKAILGKVNDTAFKKFQGADEYIIKRSGGDEKFILYTLKEAEKPKKPATTKETQAEKEAAEKEKLKRVEYKKASAADKKRNQIIWAHENIEKMPEKIEKVKAEWEIEKEKALSDPESEYDRSLLADYEGNKKTLRDLAQAKKDHRPYKEKYVQDKKKVSGTKYIERQKLAEQLTQARKDQKAQKGKKEVEKEILRRRQEYRDLADEYAIAETRLRFLEELEGPEKVDQNAQKRQDLSQKITEFENKINTAKGAKNRTLVRKLTKEKNLFVKERKTLGPEVPKNAELEKARSILKDLGEKEEALLAKLDAMPKSPERVTPEQKAAVATRKALHSQYDELEIALNKAREDLNSLRFDPRITVRETPKEKKAFDAQVKKAKSDLKNLEEKEQVLSTKIDAMYAPELLPPSEKVTVDIQELERKIQTFDDEEKAITDRRDKLIKDKETMARKSIAAIDKAQAEIRKKLWKKFPKAEEKIKELSKLHLDHRRAKKIVAENPEIPEEGVVPPKPAAAPKKEKAAKAQKAGVDAESMTKLLALLPLYVNHKAELGNIKTTIINEGLFDFISDAGREKAIKRGSLFGDSSALEKARFRSGETKNPFSDLAGTERKNLRSFLYEVLSDGFNSIAWKDPIVGNAIHSEVHMSGGKYALRQAKINGQKGFYHFLHFSIYEAPILESFLGRIGNQMHDGQRTLIYDPDVAIADKVSVKAKGEHVDPIELQTYTNMKKWSGDDDLRMHFSRTGFLVEESHTHHVHGWNLDNLTLREELLTQKRTNLSGAENAKRGILTQAIAEIRELKERLTTNRNLTAFDKESGRQGDTPSRAFKDQNYYAPNNTVGNKSKFNVYSPERPKSEVYVNNHPHTEFEAIWSDERLKVQSGSNLLVLKGFGPKTKELYKKMMTHEEGVPGYIQPILSRFAREAAQRGYDGLALDAGSWKITSEKMGTDIAHVRDALENIAKSWGTKVSGDILLTNHKTMPTDHKGKYDLEMAMGGARREHVLYVLPFTEEMYRSVPSKRKILVDKPFEPQTEEGVITRYFPDGEETVTFSELFPLLSDKNDKLKLISPYATHSFEVTHRPRSEVTLQILPDEYKGAKRDPENKIPPHLLAAMEEIYPGKMAVEAIHYFYNKEIINAYIRRLEGMGYKINYIQSAKAFEASPSIIRGKYGDFTAYDIFKNYSRGGREIHPSVVESLSETGHTAPATGKRNPATSWDRGINAEDSLYIRSGYGVNSIASHQMDIILGYIRDNPVPGQAFDIAFERAYYAEKLSHLSDESLISMIDADVFDSIVRHDVSLFRPGENSLPVAGGAGAIVEIRINHNNIARHTLIETFPEQSPIKKKAKQDFINDIKNSYQQETPLKDVNGLYLAHILGLDSLSLGASLVGPSEILLAFKDPDKYAKRAEYTDLQKTEPLYQKIEMHSEKEHPLVLLDQAMKAEHTQEATLLRVEEAFKTRDADKIWEVVELTEVYAGLVNKLKKAKKVPTNAEHNTFPGVTRPETQAIINLLNDGLIVELPMDATPRDLLRVNVDLANVLLGPKTRKIAKAYYESVGDFITQKGKADFLRELGDYIMDGKSFKALTAKQVILFQESARLIDLLWLSIRNESIATLKTHNAFEAKFQPGTRAREASTKANINYTETVQIPIRPQRRYVGERDPLAAARKEEYVRPDMSREELMKAINSPYFSPKEMVLEGVQDNTFNLRSVLYKIGEPIPLRVLYSRLLTIIQYDKMIKSKDYNRLQLGKFVPVTSRTIVHEDQVRPLNEKAFSFIRYLFKDENIPYYKLWAEHNVLQLRNEEHFQYLKSPPKTEDLVSVSQQTLETIVARNQELHSEGIPVPSYMIDIDKLKKIYGPPTGVEGDNLIYAIPRLITQTAYVRGAIDPVARMFVTEKTWNNIQRYANRFARMPMGESIEASLLLQTADMRRIEGHKRVGDGAEAATISVSKKEIHSLIDAFKDTHSNSMLARTRTVENFSPLFAVNLVSAIKQIGKDFGKTYPEMAKAGAMLGEVFVQVDNYKALKPEVAEVLKRLESVNKRLSEQMLTEIRDYMSSKEFVKNPMGLLRVFKDFAEQLTPVVDVNQIGFLHDAVDKFDIFFGRGHEIQPGKKRAIHAKDILDVEYLTGLEELLGPYATSIDEHFEMLHSYASKISTDDSFFSTLTGDDFHNIINSLYQVQTGVYRKYRAYTYQADILSVSMTKHTPSYLSPQEPMFQRNLRRKLYTTFFSGNILPPAVQSKRTVPLFRDPKHWRERTRMPLTEQNVVRYLQDSGAGYLRSSDEQMKAYIRKELDGTNIQWPSRRMKGTPEAENALIRIVNHFQQTDVLQGMSFFDISRELHAPSPAAKDVAAFGQTIYVTDPAKVLAEIIINMRGAEIQKNFITDLMKIDGTFNIEKTLIKFTTGGINPLAYTSLDKLTAGVHTQLKDLLIGRRVDIQGKKITMLNATELEGYMPHEILNERTIAETIRARLGLKMSDAMLAENIVEHTFADGNQIFLPESISDHLHQVQETVLGAGMSHGTASTADQMRIVREMRANAVKADFVMSLDWIKNKRDAEGVARIPGYRMKYAESYLKSQSFLVNLGRDIDLQERTVQMNEIQRKLINNRIIKKHKAGELYKHMVHLRALLTTNFDGKKMWKKILRGTGLGLAGVGAFMGDNIYERLGLFSLAFFGFEALAGAAEWSKYPQDSYKAKGLKSLYQLRERVEADQAAKTSPPTLQEIRQTHARNMASIEEFKKIEIEAEASYVAARNAAMEQTKEAIRKREEKKGTAEVDIVKEQNRIIDEQAAEYLENYYKFLGFSNVRHLSNSVLSKMVNVSHLNANIKMHTTIGVFGTTPYLVGNIYGMLQQMMMNRMQTGWTIGQIGGMITAGVLTDNLAAGFAGLVTGGVAGSVVHSLLKQYSGQMIGHAESGVLKGLKDTGLFRNTPTGPSWQFRPKQVAGIMLMEQRFMREEIRMNRTVRSGLMGAAGLGLGAIAAAGLGLDPVVGGIVGGATGGLYGALGSPRGALWPGMMYGGLLASALGAGLPDVAGVHAGFLSGGLGMALGGYLTQKTAKHFSNQRAIQTKSTGHKHVIPPVIAPDGKIYFGTDIHRMMSEYNVGTSYLRAETAEVLLRDLDDHFGSDLQNTVSWLGGEKWKKMLVEISESIDRYQRIQAFIDELEAGTTPAMAAEKVRNTFYDYAALTEFEKKFMRNMILFYSFARKNFDFMTAMLMKNPDRVMGFVRLRRDLMIEATDYLDPEMASNPWYAGRFFIPGFDMVSQKHGSLVYNLQDEGEGMYNGKWFPVSPLTIDYDYFLLLKSMIDVGASFIPGDHFDSMKKTENRIAAVKWLFGQMSPLAQLPLVALDDKSIFFRRQLNKENIDASLIAMDTDLSRVMGSWFPRLFNSDPNNPGGWINVNFHGREDYLSSEQIEEATRRSLASQRAYVIKGKGVPVRNYGHWTPASKQDGMRYWTFQNIIGPAIARNIPVVGALIASKTGRVGSHVRELNQYDVGTYLIGKEASNMFLRMMLFGRAVSFDDILEDTKDLPPAERRQRFIDVIIKADKDFLDKRLHTGEEEMEPMDEADLGALIDLYYRHPDTPSQVGVGRLGNFQSMPKKTGEHATELMLQDYIRRIRQLE